MVVVPHYCSMDWISCFAAGSENKEYIKCESDRDYSMYPYFWGYRQRCTYKPDELVEYEACRSSKVGDIIVCPGGL
jgi:hypothetical protein